MEIDQQRARAIIDEMENGQWAECEAEVREHADGRLAAMCASAGVFDAATARRLMDALLAVSRLGFGAGFAAGLNNHDAYMARCFKECVR